MFPRPPRSAIACLSIGLLASATLHADQDAPPVDVNALLKQLHALRDTAVVQAKTSKTAAIQQVNAAASNIAAGVALWEEAVRATQMEGAGKENAQFKAWRDSEGELFKEKEVQNAVHLHLEWLVLTLQRSNGATVKDMLPSVIKYSQELLADQAWMEALSDEIKKEKAQPGVPQPGMKGRGNRNREDPAKGDEAIKRTHDSILRTNLSASIIVQWLKLGDFVNVEKWEGVPGSLDGIYKNIVLPEQRAQKDPHVFDYWDMKLKKEADLATKSKLSFEIDKFNTQRRPALLWSRAQEYANLGQKNRAVSEMFNLIKTYPAHPDASDWMSALEVALAPPPPDAASASAVPAPTAPTAPTATNVLPPPAPVAPPEPPPAAVNGVTPTSLLPGAQ